jgi:hypothetical protein
MVRLREKVPVRSKNIYKYSDFHRYKPFLRTDFNKRCGYCNDSDIRNGGHRFYQIDHFVPQKVFKKLKSNDYHNLVYSCPFCNRAKWHKWPSNDESVVITGNAGFVDPCLTEFDNHLKRNSDGEIKAKTDLGQYMWKELNLGLKRHAIIWNIEKLINQINEVKLLLDNEQDENVKEILLSLLEEQKEFQDSLDIENDK